MGPESRIHPSGRVPMHGTSPRNTSCTEMHAVGRTASRSSLLLSTRILEVGVGWMEIKDFLCFWTLCHFLFCLMFSVCLVRAPQYLKKV